MHTIHEFITFIRCPNNSKLYLVINDQLDWPNQLIIGYDRSLILHYFVYFFVSRVQNVKNNYEKQQNS